MDDIVLLWIVVNACAFIGLIVFVPMATCELIGFAKLIREIFRKENKDD